MSMWRITCKAFKRLDEEHLPLYRSTGRTEWMETETVPTRHGIRAWRFPPIFLSAAPSPGN